MSNIQSWELRSSAPLLYPVYIEWLYAKYGVETAITCDAFIIHNGLGNNMGNCGSPEATSYPTGVDVVWCSLLEKKWYFAEIDFSKKELEWVKNLLSKGYEGYDFTSRAEKKPITMPYKKFNVCCLPGGQIRIYFSGYCREVCMDSVFQGKETHEMDDIIIHGTRFNRSESSQYWDDVYDFYDEILYEGKYRKELDELKKEESSFYEFLKNYRERKGVIPFGLWNDYYQRYDYKVQVVFENEKESVQQEEKIRFTNGESYSRKPHINPNNIILNPTPIREMSLYWTVQDRYYFCNLFFNEEETFSLFKKAFEENKGDAGTLSINVSKYNNFIEIFLNIGKASYKFEKVEINISTAIGLHGSKDYIYSNCNYSHKNKFIGF